MIGRIIGMDAGTRERELMSIVTGVVDALAVLGILKFSDEKLDAIKNLALMVLTVIVYAIGFYCNNNYTEIACQYTGEMRAEKGKNSDNYAITDDMEDGEVAEDESEEC